MTTTSCAQFGEEKNLWIRHIDQRIIQQQAFRLAPHVVRSLVLLHLLHRVRLVYKEMGSGHQVDQLVSKLPHKRHLARSELYSALLPSHHALGGGFSWSNIHGSRFLLQNCHSRILGQFMKKKNVLLASPRSYMNRNY